MYVCSSAFRGKYLILNELYAYVIKYKFSFKAIKLTIIKIPCIVLDCGRRS